MLKVLLELDLVEHAEIAVVQALWQVPVEQRHERGDSGREQRVDVAHVEGDAGLIQRVRAPAERDHARPGDGEAVCGGARGLQKADILRHAVVGVAGDIAGSAVSCFSRGVREGVPDGGTAAVFFGRTLNLVAAGRVSNCVCVCVSVDRGGGEGNLPGGGKAPEKVFWEKCFNHNSQLSSAVRVRRVSSGLRLRIC